MAETEVATQGQESWDYTIKYHWFRSRVCDPASNIVLVKIDSKNQLGDIFTKGLSLVPFAYLRRSLMGW